MPQVMFSHSSEAEKILAKNPLGLELCSGDPSLHSGLDSHFGVAPRFYLAEGKSQVRYRLLFQGRYDSPFRIVLCEFRFTHKIVNALNLLFLSHDLTLNKSGKCWISTF